MTRKIKTVDSAELIKDERHYTISQDLAEGRKQRTENQLGSLLKSADASQTHAEAEHLSSPRHRRHSFDSGYGDPTEEEMPASSSYANFVARPADTTVEGTQEIESYNSERLNATKKSPSTMWTADMCIMNPRKIIVYQIICQSRANKQWHAATAYEDRPRQAHVQQVQDDRGRIDDSPIIRHCNGTRPVLNIPRYIKRAEEQTALIIVREVACGEHEDLDSHEDGASHHEDAAISSRILKQVIYKISSCCVPVNMREKSSRPWTLQSYLDRNSVSALRLFVFHHQKLLEAHADRHPETRDHVSALLEYVNDTYGGDFAEAAELFRRGVTTAQHLDKLYRPNDVVVMAVQGTPSAFVVCDWPKMKGSCDITVEVWQWRHDGRSWQRRSCELHVAPLNPTTEFAVRALSVYPVNSLASEDVWHSLEKRGRKLWDLKQPSHVSYKGWDAKGENYYPDSRFVVDYDRYRKMHTSASHFNFVPRRALEYDDWPVFLDQYSEPTSRDYVIMPPVVHGFYLLEKQWIALNVDNVSEIAWNKSAYECLVIPEQTKSMIRALVEVRKSQKGIKNGIGGTGKRIDIVAGKGNGLIMLLHGGPGTGKSLTAESVAEIAEMPLYRVTCGDIGTTPQDVEKYMSLVMHLGVAWNCVLLLDEADVFLEQRLMSDLTRNSLVSVFLRTLEYYDGILILTSNRIGTFDEAFKSRIQVAIYYDKLDEGARKRVWTNFVNMLREDEENADFETIEARLDQLAEHDLNGRQIRNVLTTARQLALFEKKRLAWGHIQQALTASLQFNTYLQEVKGHTDEDAAKGEGRR